VPPGRRSRRASRIERFANSAEMIEDLLDEGGSSMLTMTRSLPFDVDGKDTPSPLV
jgi:hypothetical protein